MQTLFAISSKMSIFNINFSARDNLRVAAGAGDEARPLERENVDIGLQQLGLGSALAAGHGGQLTSSRRRSPGSRHGSGV